MALHFSREEFAGRVAAARRALAAADLDAIVLFAQESHYYLTGFDTSGYVFFQCAVLTAAETPITLLTRRPDLMGAKLTSTIEDVRLWYDREGADPAEELKAILADRNMVLAIIRTEIVEAKDKYGDERRTEILAHGPVLVRAITDADAKSQSAARKHIE